jgi:hypothetical protein
MSVWGGGEWGDAIEQVRFGRKTAMGEIAQAISEHRIRRVYDYAEPHAWNYCDPGW